MEYYIVDRIEEDIVVLEKSDKTHLNVNKKEFAFDVTEGDAVKKIGDMYQKDDKKTKELREEIIKLQNSLFE